MKKDEPIRIELTPDQKKPLKDTSKEEGSAAELTVQELEERVAPRFI